MEYPVWAQVLIALFAVFGVYAFVRVAAGMLFSAGQVGAALHVRTKADALRLESLLREAEDAFLFRRRCGTVVLISPEAAECLFDGDGTPKYRTAQLLIRYGAVYELTE